MSHWKLGIYGHPMDEMKEDIMDYYFVVLKDSERIEGVIQRGRGFVPSPIAGKRFVKTDGVRLTFYYRLKDKPENSGGVPLVDVMNYGT